VRWLGNRYYEALGLSHLGDVFWAAEDPVFGPARWCDALSILEELDHPEAAAIRVKLTTWRRLSSGEADRGPVRWRAG
jgi:hypothetical protein